MLGSSRNTHWRDLPLHKAKSPLRVAKTCHSKIVISNDGIYTDIVDWRYHSTCQRLVDFAIYTGDTLTWLCMAT